MRLFGLADAAALIGSPGVPAAEHPPTAGGTPDPGAGPAQGGTTPEQVKAVVEDYVQRSIRDSGGVYRIADPRGGKALDLEFLGVSLVSSGNLWKVHDPDRRVDPHAFLACTRFHPVGAPQEKLYDVDVLIEPRDGKLAVTDARVHKEMRLENGSWSWHAVATRTGASPAKPR